MRKADTLNNKYLLESHFEHRSLAKKKVSSTGCSPEGVRTYTSVLIKTLLPLLNHTLAELN